MILMFQQRHSLPGQTLFSSQVLGGGGGGGGGRGIGGGRGGGGLGGGGRGGGGWTRRGSVMSISKGSFADVVQ